MDLEEKRVGPRSEAEDLNNRAPSNQLKSCTDCLTTKTPLWRGGPSGPKTLCNACGIKYNKKRRQLLGLDKGRTDKSRKKKILKNASDRNREVEKSLKLKLMGLGEEMLFKKSERLRNKLGEVEQAAILLMTLSCGSVYA